MGIFESDKKRKFVFHALQEVVETGIEEVKNALKQHIEQDRLKERRGYEERKG